MSRRVRAARALIAPLALLLTAAVDLSPSGSVTVWAHGGGVPQSGVSVALFRVADMNADGHLTLTTDFSSAPGVDLDIASEAKLQAQAQLMASYAQTAPLTPLDNGVTNVAGMALFTALTPGLYLLTFGGEAAPALVSLPRYEGAELKYSVTVQPKITPSPPPSMPPSAPPSELPSGSPSDPPPSGEPGSPPPSAPPSAPSPSPSGTSPSPSPSISPPPTAPPSAPSSETPSVSPPPSESPPSDPPPSDPAEPDTSASDTDIGLPPVPVARLQYISPTEYYELDGDGEIIAYWYYDFDTGTWRVLPYTPEPLLPQTALLRWPVPALAALGLSALVAGILVLKREKKT